MTTDYQEIVNHYHGRRNQPAGGWLMALSYFTATLGGAAALFAVILGINFALLAGGIGIFLSSLFVWAAGKALELLSRVEMNTRTDPPKP